jgi:taurine dioxygenase
MTSFTVTPLTTRTGAEVVGLDFTKPIDDKIRDELRRAFVKHHVLVMRDQHFGPSEFKAAVELFGELQSHDKKERHILGHSDVSYVSNDESS